MRTWTRHRDATIWVCFLAVFSLGAAAEEAPLIEAVKHGDTETVVVLLQEGVDVNVRALDGTTALHWAVHRNDLATVDLLLRAAADVSVVNRYGVAPLSLACENGNAAIIERLLQAGADANTALPGGETALMTVARTGDADAVRVLLAHGADVDARDDTRRRQTALMWAAAAGHVAAVKALIEGGAAIHARSSEHKAAFLNTFIAGRENANLDERMQMFTPLLYAVRAGRLDVVRVLLEAGATVNDSVPDSGTSALLVACINAHWELAAFLLDKGADPNAEGSGGAPLHQVARVRGQRLLVKTGGLPPPVQTGTLTSLELAKKLIAHGANVNAQITKPPPQLYPEIAFGFRGQVGMTPMMFAGLPADPDLMRVLLDSGADATLTHPNGTTVLMAAAGTASGSLLGDDEEALEVVKLALEHGVDVNARNDDGDTALHGAAFRGHVPLIQFLVENGAELDATDDLGWTPLMTAHLDLRGGLLTTRPEAEAFLHELYKERGLPTVLPTREEAIEKLAYGRRGPSVTCPPSQTVESANGTPTPITYPLATATSYGNAALTITCAPPSGSEFPIGSTTVTCAIVDPNGRSDSCTVLMRVVQ